MSAQAREFVAEEYPILPYGQCAGVWLLAWLSLPKGIPMTDQATWIFLSYHAKRAYRKVFSATVSIAIRKGCLGEVSICNLNSHE
jgi:hypothetical protein